MKYCKSAISSFVFSAVVAPFVSTAAITVPSGDVDALTNALKTCATWSTVVLEAGEYDLSSLTNAPMGVSTYQGYSLLHLNVGVTLKGATGKAEEVILKGCGKYRIMSHANGGSIKDLTMMYGHAEGGSYLAGGAVYATGSAIEISNCRFLFNSGIHGGAVNNDNCKNCYFYGNVAREDWNNGGGAGCGGTYVNCDFICNTNLYTWGGGGALSGAAKVENCNVISNFTLYSGGGLYNCKNVSGCHVLYNATVGPNNARGGGLYNCGTISNCTVVGNAASSFGNGMCDTSAYNTEFRFNSSTHVSKDLKDFELVKCTFVGSGISDAAFVDLCTISAVSNVTYLSDNCHYGTKDVGITYPFSKCRHFRNTLITDCWITNLSNHAAFYSDGSVTTLVENCTIADNRFHYLMRGYKGEKTQMAFVNTAIVNNSRSSVGIGDVSGYESPNTYMTNCVVGIVELALADGIVWSDTQVLGPGGKPRFVATGDFPYTPKYSSPLRANGKRLEWMTEDSVDLAGNARLRDGKVDIGAYQCWLDPIGAMLILR